MKKFELQEIRDRLDLPDEFFVGFARTDIPKLLDEINRLTPPGRRPIPWAFVPIPIYGAFGAGLIVESLEWFDLLPGELHRANTYPIIGMTILGIAMSALFGVLALFERMWLSSKED